uniref:profilin-1-like n=1 Tax=Pristiophorus japonicus TaxID=55135 RepID=UPI00398F7A1F
MSSWQFYIDDMLATGHCADVVLVGFEGTPSVWASVPDGNLSKITPDQIRSLVQKDRTAFFTNGVRMGPYKYMVTNDRMFDENARTLVLSRKTSNDESIFTVVGKSQKVLLIAEGITSTKATLFMDQIFKNVSHLVNNGT